MNRPRQRLYRDVENGRIAGVCAGISDHFGFELGMVRFICILGCVFFAWFTIPAYLLMAFTLPVKPGQEGKTVRGCRFRKRRHRRGERSSGESDPDEAELEEDEASEDTDWRRFDQGVNRAPRDVFQSVRHSFRELEVQLQRMERYVTSRHYELDREFRDLET
jgi:phage shock protein C